MVMNSLAARRSLFHFTILIVALHGSSAAAGLIGYWDFEGTALDQSPNHLDGRLVGDVAFDHDVPEPIESTSSLRLDGDGDWIDLGNPPELNFATNDWTVAGWLKTTRTGLGNENEGTLFGNGGDCPPSRYPSRPRWLC
jgi:hypothetical protein